MSTQQAAEQLGIDDSRVRQLILQGRLPAMKVGRAHLILKEDLALVADRRPGRPPKAKAEEKAVRKPKKSKR